MHLVRPAVAPRGAASLLRPGRFRARTRAHLALADAGPGGSPTRARQDTGMPSAEATRPGPRPAATGYRGPAAKMPDPASLAADHAGPGRGCQSRPLRRAPSVLKTSEAVAARLCRVAPSMIESPQCDCGRTAGLVRTSGRLRPAGVIPRYHYQPRQSPLSTLNVIVTLLFVVARAMSRAAPARIVWLPSSNAAPLARTSSPAARRACASMSQSMSSRLSTATSPARSPRSRSVRMTAQSRRPNAVRLSQDLSRHSTSELLIPLRRKDPRLPVSISARLQRAGRRCARGAAGRAGAAAAGAVGRRAPGRAARRTDLAFMICCACTPVSVPSRTTLRGSGSRQSSACSAGTCIPRIMPTG